MRRGRRLLEVAVIAAVAIAVYLGAAGNAFVFDDEKLVRDNPWIRSPARVAAALNIASDRWEDEPIRLNYRPIRFISYAIDWQVSRLLFGSFAPEDVPPHVFRIHNMLLHAANALLVLVIARRILGGRARAGPAALAPALAAFIFAVHPVHTESVTYISGRRDVLFAFFALAALALHLRPGPIGLRRGAGIAALYILALLTKEMAAPFPVLAFLCDRTVARTPLRGRRAYYAALGAIAAAFVLFALLVRNPGAGAGLWGGSRWAAALTMARAFFLYGRLLVWPHPLTVDYSFDAFPVSHGLLAPPATLAALAGIAGLAAAAAWAWRKGRPWAAFALGWFAVSLSPVAQIAPHPERVAEHFLYLPSVAPILAATAAWLALERWGRPLAIWAATLACVALPLVTLARNRDWRDSYALWRQAVEVHPRCARAQLAYGKAALKRAEEQTSPAETLRLVRAAVRALDRALAILPASPPDALRRGQRLHALLYRGQALGRLAAAEPGALDRAIADYRALLRMRDVDEAAIADAPEYAAIRFDLAMALYANRDFAAAEGQLRSLFDLVRRYPERLEGAPRLTVAKFVLGAVVAAQGRTGEGERLMREAASEATGDAARQYWREIALLALAAGRWDEARKVLERLAAGPGGRDPDILYDLARALDRLGDLSHAIDRLEMALARDPGHIPSLLLLGDIRANFGRYDDAEMLLRRAAAAAPGDPRPGEALTRLALRRKLAAAPAPGRKERPPGPEVFLHAAQVKAGEQAWEEARELLDRALAAAQGPERRPARVEALDLMAKVKRNLGDAEGAVAALLELADLAPDRADVLFELARAYYELGRLEASRAACERFLASDADPALRAQVAAFLRKAILPRLEGRKR